MVASPSTLGGSANTISPTVQSSAFSFETSDLMLSLSMVRYSSGDIRPLSTWYTPLYWPVASM